jgi:hypothetical protein
MNDSLISAVKEVAVADIILTETISPILYEPLEMCAFCK